ncbi:MAG TPA: SgcJ/EcaC family oxidoreductase [Thiolinea sp.]|nr:SgcJ/EcaC family oxidoreductase [Thiolinea sp.]
MNKSLLNPVIFSSLLLGACTTNEAKLTEESRGGKAGCKTVSEQEIGALFDRWNKSLQTGDAKQVVANYYEKSILLPTVSNKPRLTAEEKEDYFHHFLEMQPAGKIDSRHIQIACDTALDAGLYTFKMKKTGKEVKARYSFTYKWTGQDWLITSHHSSALPEKTTKH